MSIHAEIRGKRDAYDILVAGKVVATATNYDSACACALNAENRAALYIADRACLCCGATFESWGVGNRRCPSCTGKLRHEGLI